MTKNFVEFRLSYILSIVIPSAGLLWYIISDIFSMGKSTLYSQILNRIMAEIFISWALIILLMIFLIYVFLEGLQFTDNNYLIKLSKYSNKFYTLGFELSFVIVPTAFIFFIFIYINNEYNLSFLHIILYFSIVLMIIYFLIRKISSGNIKKYYELINILVFISLTFHILFGVFQLSTADVNINFDKTYYRADDHVVITIHRSGITYPHINEISINKNVINPITLFTSDEGQKEIIIYNIDTPYFGDSNYKIVEVDVDYSIDFLYWRGLVNRNKFASFIIVK